MILKEVTAFYFGKIKPKVYPNRLERTR